mgnify:CR=1 FL=1
MKLILDTALTAQENAQRLFDDSKKLKQKIKGAQEGILEVQKKIALLQKKSASTAKALPQKRRSKEWFEKFRWCYTRNGLLCVGGRDAHSNEALVKRHMEKDDWYFHADVFGAPHCLLKHDKKKPTKQDFEDAASFAGVFSSVWKKGQLSVRVYKVSPEQVSKKAPAGESLGKGAFMIYGERDWFDPDLKFGLGVQLLPDGFRIMGGPFACVKAHAQHVIEIASGQKSKSDIAKSYQRYLAKKINPLPSLVDEIVSILPAGEFSLKLNE